MICHSDKKNLENKLYQSNVQQLDKRVHFILAYLYRLEKFWSLTIYVLHIDITNVHTVVVGLLTTDYCTTLNEHLDPSITIDMESWTCFFGTRCTYIFEYCVSAKVVLNSSIIISLN